MFKKKKTEGELKLFRFILSRFGYRPNKIFYFQKAITHKSFISHSESDYSNERLEFLGDAILDSITAEFLFLKFPESNEFFASESKSFLDIGVGILKIIEVNFDKYLDLSIAHFHINQPNNTEKESRILGPASKP